MRDRLQMTKREAVPLGQDLADALAMADVPIRLVAEKAGGRVAREFGGAREIELGLGCRELLLDDAPEARPVAAPVGLAPVGRCPQCLQVHVSEAGRRGAGFELALGK